ncbi:MAG: DUF1570 domain-containing protein [Phycisphaerales bacterium]|nr:DUF1570 domain-containing protein [Planctomycetota bacterium]MCH8507417.1 DUF1570 domain-containing protein [Phycisphaerales bacterium]
MIRRAVCAALALAPVAFAACSAPNPRGPAPGALAGADPVRFVADREPWHFQGNPGWRLTTPSVELHTTVTDRRLLHRLPPFLELAHAHRMNAITPLLPARDPLRTYVLASRSQWEAMTRSMLRDSARAYLRIERGGYAVNGMGVFYDLGPRDTFVIAAHEGWHQFVQSSFGDPLPVWLDEGLACYFEGFRWRSDEPDTPEFLPWMNPQRFDQLRAAAAGDRLMPLHELLLARPQDLLDTDRGGDAALTYYAQCWAFVHFLVESDNGARRPGLERMLRDAQAGRLVNAVSAIAGEREATLLRTRRVGVGAMGVYWPEESIGSMDAAYQAFILRIVRTGGRDRALMGRSPILD